VPGVIVSDTSLVAPVGDIEPATRDQIIRVPTELVTFLA
jgi:hypothetical protein